MPPKHRTGFGILPKHWAIGFAVEGDLRFLSHHDMMRAVERTFLRAKVPLRFSQGFNPRPTVSLACPRPVGVASLDDLAVVAMDDSAPPPNAAALLDSLNATSPRGLRFTRAQPIERKTMHATRIECELPLTADEAAALPARLVELAAQDRWCIQRESGEDKAPREIDLKPLVKDLEIAGEARGADILSASAAGVPPATGRQECGRDAHATTEGETVAVLRWTLLPAGQSWARPGEVLALLGLDAEAGLARVVRRAVQYE